MIIKNFKWVSSLGNSYTIEGQVDLLPNTGFGFTKITKINNVKKDSIIIRNQIKHEEILNYINKNG